MRAFRELARVFQKMERTSSSTALVATLAEFLSKRSPNEARAVAYLLRGELAPAFESLEIGMAERMVARAVDDVEQFCLIQSPKDATDVVDCSQCTTILHSRCLLGHVRVLFAQTRAKLTKIQEFPRL